MCDIGCNAEKMDQLRDELAFANARIELLERDMKSGDYESLYAQVVFELDELRKSKLEEQGWLFERLRMWKDLGEPAPLNELQSIAAWLQTLGEKGPEGTKKSMRIRMTILMQAAEDLYALGRLAEDEVGIYTNRPDMRPTEDGEQE